MIARALADWFVELPLEKAALQSPVPPTLHQTVPGASGWLLGAYRLATRWLQGGLGVASGAARDAIAPVPPKTAKCGPQPPKSAIESHLRFAESFRVHGPISTSESAAVSTPPPRNNSLRYIIYPREVYPQHPGA